MKGTKRLAVLAMFTAIALTIFVAEAQIPPVVPIPGVKLGLANIVTLIAMALLGRRQAGEILLVRIVLGSVFTGGVSAMLFSIAGGVFAYLVMCLTLRRLPERLLWVVSVLAAFGHNAGQLLVAVWVTGTPSILVYAPALVAASVVTGAFTGVAAVYLVRALRKTGHFPQTSSASSGSPPGRRSRGGVQVRSMIVDSTPTAHGPPSNIPSILPSMSSIMSAMHVGLGRPDVLPEGAAMGTSAAAMTARVMGWFGQRTPTVSNPPVVRSGTMGFRGKIMVSGPGQNFSASA